MLKKALPFVLSALVGFTVGWSAKGKQSQSVDPFVGSTINIIPPQGEAVYNLSLAEGPPAEDESAYWCIVTFDADGNRKGGWTFAPKR